MAAKSSEDVLLITNHVRHKKTDGVLYLMGERLGWMVESKSSFSISYLYTDIKSQKISPDTKDKVQLQIVLHDGGAKTFHFTNKKGRETAIQDRDGIKELLQHLLPQHRQKISTELEDKKRHLQEDPETFQLYKDLVVSGVISAEEFWVSRADKLTGSAKSDGNQSVGVSAAFLADIKPQTDGCNGLKYNLTADVIESIFRTYPAVKKKHAEHVPHSMTESEFWTRFFQSHYFHRDRSTIGSKDVFSDCAKNDDQEIREEITKSVDSSMLDMTHMNDSSLDEGYGGVSSDRKASSNQTNLTMIRRFNHHSTMVLKACENKKQKQLSHDNMNGHDSAVAGPSNSNQNTSSNNASLSNDNNSATNPQTNGQNVLTRTSTDADLTNPVSKRAKIQEKIEYEDLQDKVSVNKVDFKLHKMEGYLHGPTPVTLTKYTHSQHAIQASQSVSHEISQWCPDLSSVLSESLALGVLGELSPGGTLMQGSDRQQLHQMVTPDVQEEMKTQYNALLELLRHFWTCFPANSKFLEDKAIRMKSTLERFQVAKLEPLKDKVQHYRYTVDLTGHMDELLMTAYTKFETWQTKRMNKRS